MDGWNTIVSFWGPAYFQVRTVSFRECICLWEHKSQFSGGVFFQKKHHMAIYNIYIWVRWCYGILIRSCLATCRKPTISSSKKPHSFRGSKTTVPDVFRFPFALGWPFKVAVSWNTWWWQKSQLWKNGGIRKIKTKALLNNNNPSKVHPQKNPHRSWEWYLGRGVSFWKLQYFCSVPC